jgi:hypothetical protein
LVSSDLKVAPPELFSHGARAGTRWLAPPVRAVFTVGIG